MISALYRYPRGERRAVAQQWARRSHESQAKKRIERGVDADTLRSRTLDDARGQIVREGCDYHGNGETVHWRVIRSLKGRSDQFDFVANGVTKLTAGPRLFPLRIRPTPKPIDAQRVGLA